MLRQFLLEVVNHYSANKPGHFKTSLLPVIAEADLQINTE